jgi:iduronate 2-sulfatase
VALALWLAACSGEEPGPYNVLFLSVDDLGAVPGCYGGAPVETPNIDRLAERGTLFERAYCQNAICNPSRASLLTGLRHDTLGVFNHPTHFRDVLPDVVTLPQHFRARGYHTETVGKTFHTAHGNRDDPRSWSRVRDFPRVRPPAVRAPYGSPDVDDLDMPDGRIARAAVEALGALKRKRFFLSVGFNRPHLPFLAPKKYWDLYDERDVRLARYRGHPRGAPAYTSNGSSELRSYDGVPAEGPIDDELARTLVHGYWASVSYADACVGRVLDELDRLELREQTIVVLWSDHGLQVGEHGMWGKETNYEESLRVPLIVSVPGGAAGRTKALVELVDLFPTLAELCELAPPQGLEGTSSVPLLADPDLPWKRAAFSFCQREVPGKGRGTGRSLRTVRWRFVEWTFPGAALVEHELYDHDADPGEDENVASAHPETVAELSALLGAGWRSWSPP